MPLSESAQFEKLEVRGLKKRVGGVQGFELRADFEVQPGERLAVLGRSGSGKTTLLRLIAGLESLAPSRDQGTICLGAREITHVSPQSREIGYVFQDAALFESMSVLENAAFGLRMRGVGRSQRCETVLPWLERVGLRDRADHGVQRLSGGERQRVAFVRALVWKPRLLLLDEPFSALDHDLRQTLREELLRLHAAWPVPLIVVTHDREDVEALATRSAMIDQTVSGVRALTLA
jgi:ABC-type Fe3+/spermidine/putrescine transport system ATPase subunit